MEIPTLTLTASMYETLISTETPEFMEYPADGIAAAPTTSTSVAMAPPCKELVEFCNRDYIFRNEQNQEGDEL